MGTEWTYGQNGVVSVEEGVSDQVPGSLPRELFLIDEDAHELGNGEGWVGLVSSE